MRGNEDEKLGERRRGKRGWRTRRGAGGEEEKRKRKWRTSKRQKQGKGGEMVDVELLRV